MSTIRKAVVEDAFALADLIRGLDLFGHINSEPAETTRERAARHLALCLADDSHSIYVAEGQPVAEGQSVAEDPSGSLLGYISVHWLPYLILAGPEGYVSELFIAENARGQGVGARLLDIAEVEARRRGCARLMLLNMRKRESYQRGFYTKHGWEERENAANFVRYLT